MREISKAGILMLEYERIKQQLISEKIIPKPPEERKPLPEFPRMIGVITSRNGAAFQDIIKTIEERYPESTIHLFHSGVQGRVETQIAEALKRADASKADLLLLARGGGAIEDLWCFNHPLVAKTVRTCKKPIIVGVGHETDHTLCEYAADYIGSTPTAAAMLATPDLKSYIEAKKSELEKITILLHRKSAQGQSLLNHTMKMIHHLKPSKVISRGLLDIATQFERISIAIQKRLTDKKQELVFLNKILQNPSASLKYRRLENQLTISLEKIKSNDPKRYLKKGFTRIEKDGTTVNSVVQLKKGDLIDIFLKDGKARSEIVESIKDD